MKSNLKSGNAVVRLLLAHGEKIGILAIIVCTGLIIWSAVGRERLDKEPTDLSNLARAADENVTSASWEKIRQGEDSAEVLVIAEPLPPSVMVKSLRMIFRTGRACSIHRSPIQSLQEPIRCCWQ